MPDNIDRKKPRFIKYPEILDRLCESLATGVPLTHAASSAGVATRVVDQWRKKGSDILARIDDEDLMEETLTEVQAGYLSVWRRTEKSLHELMSDSLSSIQLAGKDHWQAAAWILERRFPKYFSHTNRIKFDMSNAQTMLDLIIKDIIPFVPEDRHNELADKLDTLMRKLSISIGGDEAE